MKPVPVPFTRADWNLLPEGFPAQLVEGMLLREAAPTFGHQLYVQRILRALAPLVPENRTSVAPSDVVIDDINIYQPDVLVLREPPPLHESNVGIPLVAFEVISKRTARREREVKRRRMLDAGVAEVWIVDPRLALIEVFESAGCRTARDGQSISSTAIRGFSLVPAALFRPASDRPPSDRPPSDRIASSDPNG